MALRQLGLCLLLTHLLPIWAKEQTCLTSASDCNECIQSGPQCAWCTDPHSKLRCHTLNRLRRAGCPKSHMYNPQGSVQVIRNDSSTGSADTEALLLQPQELTLRLRPGVSQSFPLTITMPTDKPIPEISMNTSPVPAGVNITFGSIINGNLLIVRLNVEAAQCGIGSEGSNRTGPWSVNITPQGFSQSVKVEVTLECECDCMRNREENSSACSGHGALVCGQCKCYDLYAGQHCERNLDSTFSRNEDFCRQSLNTQVCSGRGTCVEGICECHMRENPKEKYTGRYCECSNFDCPYHNNSLCGGHGKCECGECICDDAWTGDHCSCSMETASCTSANQQLCNGRGMCRCGTCQCEPQYAGPTCEICPSCLGSCMQHVACVECRAFGMGAKKDRCEEDCGYLSLTMVETRDDLPQPGTPTMHCKKISHDDSCIFSYAVTSTPSGVQSTVVKAKECPFLPWR